MDKLVQQKRVKVMLTKTNYLRIKSRVNSILFALFFILGPSVVLNAQCTLSQLGIDIDGEAAIDQSGRSVSLSTDGLTVAIGAPGNDGGGTDKGHVRVFKNISGTWTQQGADIDGETNGDNSGWSVSLSADGLTVAIGAYKNAGGGTSRGHVRIYKNLNGTWTQQGADIDGEANFDHSGYSVSLSADGLTVAIGARNNAGGGTERGHVRIYKNINGTWTQQGADIDGEANNDKSGWSVSLSADGLTVAIGAYINAGGGFERGHVRVYKNISGTWTQQGADIDGEANNDQSGFSVSLSDDGLTVAIGAIYNDGNGTAAGHVRVYKNISGTWTQQGADIDGETSLDLSGFSVSLSDDGLTVAIGAIQNAGGGKYSGHVRVYKNISGTWTQQGADINGEAAGDFSGNSVSLSSDGNTVAIGAPFNGGNGSQAGHVRVYQLSCPAPEINLKGNNVSIVDGDNTPSLTDSTDMGSTATSSSIKRRYRIVNTGTDTLKISSIVSSGTHASEFMVSGAPSRVLKNDSAIFYVTFTPTAAGARTATITINNNDANEAVYDFAITGTGTSAGSGGCTLTQLGIDIDGEADNDQSGISVSTSADGLTVAIGAYYNAGGGTQRGQVRVYKNISGTWTQQGADIDGEADIDQSGYSVSLSADGLTVAIGASNNAGGGSYRGHVRVYKNISGTWTQQGADIDGEADDDYSGNSVSLSADGLTVAIGAYNNEGGGAYRGHVRVYKNISGTWTQQGADIDGEADGDQSGNSVSLSADGLTVAIGANNNAGGGSRRGHVRVYKNISGTWTQQGADIDGEANIDLSGSTVSLSADGLTVAIGAIRNAAGGTQRGQVRVYKNISGTWTQQGADIDGEADYDNSGYSVSLSADGITVAIGAYLNAGGGIGRGHVRVYKNISGTWTQQGADIDGEADYDYSGFSVSLSADGLTVAAGASYNAGGGSDRGHVRVYKLSCPAPEINLKGNNVSIVDGDNTPSLTDSTGFGTVASGTKRRYKLFNTGAAALTISSIISSGTHASEFVVSGAPSSIAAGDSAIFTVTFTTVAAGLRTATMSINNNDADEGAYDFAIAATLLSSSSCGPVGRINATTNVTWSKDHIIFKKITLPNGTLDSLGIAVASSVVSKVFLYSNNAGNPDQLLSETASSTLATGNNVLNVSDISITAGDYWIGAIAQSVISFNITTNTLAIKYIAWPYATALPATAPSNINYTYKEIDIWPIICTGPPPCNLSSSLPTAAGTYSSTQTGTAGAYTCYCDADGKLLLALDTNGTRAVISKDSVRLQIGNPSPTVWGIAGGIITNSYGGVIFNRKWDVKPTTQPTSPVKVKFFFTQEEYDSVRIKLATMGTTITSPTQFEMYKLFTSGFGDPHASGATGIIIMNGNTPSLNNWKYAASGTDHSAEFLVSSFSGGGGGAGAGAIPLPVEFISFTAKGISNTSALLKWQTATEVNNNYFEVERSLDGVNFIKIGTVNANGNKTGNYQYIDNTISIGTPKAFYRIKQVDENGKSASTNIQLVNFGVNISNIVIYPNPLTSELNIELNIEQGETANITISDMMGKTVFNSDVYTSKSSLDLSALYNGVYTISIQQNGVVENYKIVKQ